MTKKWNADDYQDEFRTKLRKIIDEQMARQKGKNVRERPRKPSRSKPPPTSWTSWSCSSAA
jgi:non-homologous end joining protein Ku